MSEQEALRTIRKRAALFYSVFSSGNGALVMQELAASFDHSVVHTRGDPYETAFRDGQRSVYQQIARLTRAGEKPENINIKVIGAQNFDVFGGDS